MGSKRRRVEERQGRGGEAGNEVGREGGRKRGRTEEERVGSSLLC